MTSKWDNPYKVNASRSLTDVLVLYEEHIRNTPRLWQSLYEIDTEKNIALPAEVWPVLLKLRLEQRDARASISRRCDWVNPKGLR